MDAALDAERAARMEATTEAAQEPEPAEFRFLDEAGANKGILRLLPNSMPGRRER